MSGSSCVPRIQWLCDPWGLGDPQKISIFRGFEDQKTISSYSFDRIVLIFGYIVERIILKFSRAIFLQFPS